MNTEQFDWEPLKLASSRELAHELYNRAREREELALVKLYRWPIGFRPWADFYRARREAQASRRVLELAYSRWLRE